MSNTKSTKNTVLLIIVALVSLGLGLWASQQLGKSSQLPPELEATFLPQGKPLADFALQDHNGQLFSLQRFKGHWSFMFFGYTNCPDVCPLGMKVMQGVWKQLPQDIGKDAQMVFVSVDPDRDSLATLKDYVSYFHPDFVGVTGDAQQIGKLTGQIGILYGFEDKNEDGQEYIVNHSAQIVLIDPQARLRAVFSPPHEADKIATTFAKIRNFTGE